MNRRDVVRSGGGGRPWLTGAALLATAASTFVPGLAAAAEWTRGGGSGSTGLASCFTCHLSHWSGAHWAWNAAALLLTGLVAEPRARRALLVATVLSAAAIVPAVAALAPGIASYRGASGIATAWFVVALVEVGRRATRPARVVGALAVLVLLAKLLGELGAGSQWFVDAGTAGFAPVPLAHVVGAACGLAAALPCCAAPRGVQQPA